MDSLFSNAVIYMFHISTILLNVLLINSEAEIPTAYFKGRGYTWKEARDRCKLIGLFDKIQVSENINKPYGWVDASVEYTPWVEYKKCFRVKPKYKVKNTSVTYGNQLQECLQFCKGYYYIGLQQANCVCLSLNRIDSDTVNSSCSRETTERCRIDKYSYCANAKINSNGFSIYKTGNINEEFGFGNCLSVSKLSDQRTYFQARQCENTLSSFCTPNSADITIQRYKSDWISSAEHCSQYHLISYNAYKILNRIDEGEFWLADIRRPIIRNFVDFNQTYCIAVKVGKTNHEVSWIVRPCIERYPALCDATKMVDDSPGLESKENRSNDILLIALVIASVLTVLVIIAVIVVYKRGTTLRTGHRPVAVLTNEVTYAQVNKPTKEKTSYHADDSTRDNTANDTYDYMEHHRLSQNQIPTESNYDTMQSVGIEELENNYDVTNEKDRKKRIVIDESAEYSHMVGEVE